MDGWITCLRQLGRVVDLKKTFCQHLWNESARLQRVRPGILAPQLRFQLSSHMYKREFSVLWKELIDHHWDDWGKGDDLRLSG